MHWMHQNQMKAVVAAALSAAAIGFQAPIASAQADQQYSTYQRTEQHSSYSRRVRSSDVDQGGYAQNRYHQTTIVDGKKYYWHNGQRWVMDLVSKERHPVYESNDDSGTYSAYPGSSYRGHYKYYTFDGHRYVMNLKTGRRTMLR